MKQKTNRTLVWDKACGFPYIHLKVTRGLEVNEYHLTLGAQKRWVFGPHVHVESYAGVVLFTQGLFLGFVGIGVTEVMYTEQKEKNEE
jgi:hypothetical protein